MSPGCPRLLGERWGQRGRLRPPRSRPLFWWRFLGSGVTACYFHSMAPTAALRAGAGGLGLARSPAPRIPGTGRDVERSLPEISDGNGKAPEHGGMLSPLLPPHGVLCPCSSFPSVTVPGWCLGAHPGCRDPAESQQVPSCALTPAPGQARSPLPSRVPPTPEGQKQNQEFPSSAEARGVAACPDRRVTQVPPKQRCPAGLSPAGATRAGRGEGLGV